MHSISPSQTDHSIHYLRCSHVQLNGGYKILATVVHYTVVLIHVTVRYSQRKLFLAIVAALSDSSPTKMTTSSRTRMSCHTPLSHTFTHSPSFLCLDFTIMISLQLSSSCDQRYRKLDHRTFHVESSITILMTPMRTHRTLKEEGADRKMTFFRRTHHTSQYTRLRLHRTTHHIEHRTTASLHVAHTACVTFINEFLERTATTGFRHFRHAVWMTVSIYSMIVR